MSGGGGGKVREWEFATVCSSNMNRSMEAHFQLQNKGYHVRSFGTVGAVCVCVCVCVCVLCVCVLCVCVCVCVWALAASARYAPSLPPAPRDARPAWDIFMHAASEIIVRIVAIYQCSEQNKPTRTNPSATALPSVSAAADRRAGALD